MTKQSILQANAKMFIICNNQLNMQFNVTNFPKQGLNAKNKKKYFYCRTTTSEKVTIDNTIPTFG